MSSEVVEERIENGVRITVYADGHTHFEVIKVRSEKDLDFEDKPPVVIKRSWWQRLCDWWNDTPVTPYVMKRDLSDPFGDKDYDGGTHKAWEAGVKIKF